MSTIQYVVQDRPYDSLYSNTRVNTIVSPTANASVFGVDCVGVVTVSSSAGAESPWPESGNNVFCKQDTQKGVGSNSKYQSRCISLEEEEAEAEEEEEEEDEEGGNSCAPDGRRGAPFAGP
jgi:hypothetical protein